MILLHEERRKEFGMRYVIRKSVLCPVLSFVFLGMVFTGGVCLAAYNGVVSSNSTQQGDWQYLITKDLSNFVYKPGSWVVENGELVHKGGGSIFTKEKYKDFVLDLEVKLAKNSNSGIFIRNADNKQWIHHGIEVQVLDSYGKKADIHSCGAIYDCVIPKRNMAKRPGQWNHYTITCEGSKLYVVLNGVQIIDMDMSRWTEPHKNPNGTANKFPIAFRDLHEGYIGFQDHNSPVWYRNIKIKRLDTDAPCKADKVVVDSGFKSIFNGRDLRGWKGVLLRPYDNPIKRAQLTRAQLRKKQAQANKFMREHWKAKDGVLYFDGKGFSLATNRDYGDFEMLVDWKLLTPHGDSGIYLRGAPQVQIWDPAQWKIGSGGLYNNKKHISKPLVTADNPIGCWNTFRIKMVGQRVTVHLNGKLVVDNVVMENYWDRNKPIFSTGEIELQCHGSPICFRNIYIREIKSNSKSGNVSGLTQAEKQQGFVSLFNGKNLDGWEGNTKGYVAENGEIVVHPELGRGNLYTVGEYSDFDFRFEFKLTPGANNGIGIRAPLKGDAAYKGMEIQVLDNTAKMYAHLHPYQYHGSIYGVVPAKRGYLKPVGQWNSEEIIARGTHIKVILNGTVIVDADISGPIKNGTMDHRAHPGLKNKKGHIGFLGHGDRVYFRNIRIKELGPAE